MPPDETGRHDRAFLVGLGMTNGGSDQDDAAHAVLQAAQDLGYPAGTVTATATALSSCGYTVEIPGAARCLRTASSPGILRSGARWCLEEG